MRILGQFRVLQIVLVPLHKIERNSDLSELLIKYKQYSLPFKLCNPDLQGLAREFWASSEFYKIVLVLLIKRGVPRGRDYARFHGGILELFYQF